MEIKEPRTRTSEVVVALVCDLCGTRSTGRNWEVGIYDRDRVYISGEQGKRYPDDDAYDVTRVDMCPTCFRSRLLPWLLAQGGQYRIEEKAVSFAGVAAEFFRLVAQWRVETAYDSRFHVSAAYQQIIDLGWPVVPVLLGELDRFPDWWFTALTEITGEQPVRSDHAGDLLEMTEDWLAWGRQRGLVPARGRLALVELGIKDEQTKPL